MDEEQRASRGGGQRRGAGGTMRRSLVSEKPGCTLPWLAFFAFFAPERVGGAWCVVRGAQHQ